VSELGRKSLQTFVVKVVLQAAGVVASIVIARALGPAGKGLWTYAYTVLAAAIVLNGQPAAIAWQYTKRNRTPAEISKVAIRILLVVAIPLALGLALIGAFVPGQQVLLWVAAAALPALFVQSASGFFLADSDVFTVNMQQMISSIGLVIVAAPLLIVFHGTIWQLLAVWTLANLSAAIYTAIRLRPYASIRRHTGQRAPLFREQLSYTVANGLNGLVLYLNFRVDVFIVMFMLGQSALGVYSIGLSIGEMLWQLSRSITTASFGRIARGNEADSAAATATCMRHSLALVLLSAVAVAAVTPVLLPLVYGRAFAGAVEVTWFLLPGIVAYSMMGPLTTFFTQQLGEPRLPLIFRTISMLICAGATIALIPRFGIVGGAIATSVSYLATFGLAATHFVRRTGIASSRLFRFSKGDLLPYRSLFATHQPAKR